MGNSFGLGNSKKLNGGCDITSDSKLKMQNCLKINKVWDRVKGCNFSNAKRDRRNPIESLFSPDVVEDYHKNKSSFMVQSFSIANEMSSSSADSFEKQANLLKELFSCRISQRNGAVQLYHLFNIVQDLRDTGFDLDDKLIAHIILISLEWGYERIIKEKFECSKEQQTCEAITRIIIEHANKLKRRRKELRIALGLISE